MTPSLRLFAALVAALLPAAGAASCDGNSKSGQGAPGAAGSSSAAPASSLASAIASAAEADDGNDQVRPVYPVTKDPPDPLATRFCETIHELPANRKAECCKGGHTMRLTSECSRVLSFALREKSVSLDPADVDKCAEAMTKATEGCGWVTPLHGKLPAACDGIIKGTVAEGSRCRASLECADGLRCFGSGTTSAGTCRKPVGKGGPCSHSVDTLASYTLQASSDLKHPECAGYCARRWCADTVPVGGACSVSVECGAGRYCIDKKCAEGPLPEAGKPCRGGLCAEGARCVAGQCAPLGKDGEACERDADCASGCEKPAGSAKGKCALKCWPSLDALKR
jgi:hypothetical protein